MIAPNGWELGLVAPLLDALGPLIEERWKEPDASPQAVIVARRALDYWQITTTPVATDLVVFNQIAAEICLERGVLLHKDDPELPVALARGYYTARFRGHVVLLSPSQMIDPALFQFGRADKGLPLEASSFEKPPSTEGSAGYRLPHGGAALYFFRPDLDCDGLLRDVEASDPALYRKLAGEVIRAIKATGIEIPL